ncbi:ribosomal RNA processing protein 1 homolog B isoform X3 [Diceros bicornis minor]|uniref:ribosomal RNA processing protein 1 homolog B isoform X3 n=1 Tax=Diceros bicornis minor TaxID=77932 RepID=UPI0026F00224|nr:ribosomal RNA processing protein 1 homolog B isoform X3 [Diceros bicornis minor]
MAPAMQPAEIQFAQRLASHEKGIRDRAVKKLRQYLSVKTQRETGGFTQEELLKIWKGLFYCMWVQDEPLLQEELANTISQLIHVVNNSEAQYLFIQTFWQTVNREWKGIDTLHLDKYYMLIRLVLRQSFEVLKRNGWEESRIKLFLDVFMKEILHPESQSPNGVKFHFIDIYLDELSKVGGKELLADQNLKFIDPFCKIAAKTKDHTLVQTIARGVFEVIVDQSPFVPEETAEEQKTKVSDSDLSEGDVSENEMTWRKTNSKRKTALGRYHSRKDGVGDDSERGGGGSLEDAGPLLQFDYKAVADRLLEITNRKNIPPFNRKRLSRLIKKFQGLSEAGSIPQLSFAEDISADEDHQTLSQGRHKKKGSTLLEKTSMEKEKGNRFFPAEEEKGEGSVKKKKRKKKKKNHLQPAHLGSEGEATSPEQNGDSAPEAGPRRAQKASVVELGAAAVPSPLEQGGSEHPLTHSRRKRPRKRSPGVQRDSSESAVSPLEDVSQSGPCSGRAQGPVPRASPVLKKKRKLGALPVNGSGPPAMAWPPPQKEGPPVGPADGGACPAALPQGRRLKKKKGEPSSLHTCDPSSQKTAILKKRKKMKEMSSLVGHSGVLESEVKLIRALGLHQAGRIVLVARQALVPCSVNRQGSPGAFSPSKKQQLRTENNFVKFDTPFLPKPLFFRKAKSGTAASSPNPAVQLNKMPSSSKKVTFGLNRNMTAEFKKTDKSILVSPTGPSRVAFNPEQRPLHGVLKTPTSSPASAPLGTRKLLTATPKRRPTAMDFF